jgi:hypothetical protein
MAIVTALGIVGFVAMSLESMGVAVACFGLSALVLRLMSGV